ncbi:MAG: hypothetical protein IPO27_07900 [Bacteroidetes bacterium]|nr:hypothetical protein [Bacteroidota bacterium]
MNRRSFLKKSMVASAGAFAAPYILPSGRLFAATGARKVNHVVFCLFAGGVRNFESIQKAEGNLMRAMLNGNEAITADILPAMSPLPNSPLPLPLQNYGTLYKEFRYGTGPTGHYNGHTTAVTGTYTAVDLNIRDNPANPTIFEYYRKYNSTSQSALNTWWVSNSLGPYPALNYSKYPGYGAAFGANFIAPTFLISQEGYDALGNMQSFTSSEEATIKNIRNFMNLNFNKKFKDNEVGVVNETQDVKRLQDFILDKFNKAVSGQYANPWNLANGGIMTNDMYNILFAEEIIQEFKPELMVVNMQDVDICHSNFTQYCNNLRKSDYAVAHLWNTIQNTPGMANDTIMIIAPEHGRNLNPNSIVDNYGRKALDHTSDQTSREIFCMVIGPPSVVKQGQVINSIQGESIDIVPTIANILGFDTGIPNGMLSGQVLQQSFI